MDSEATNTKSEQTEMPQADEVKTENSTSEEINDKQIDNSGDAEVDAQNLSLFNSNEIKRYLGHDISEDEKHGNNKNEDVENEDISKESEPNKNGVSEHSQIPTNTDCNSSSKNNHDSGEFEDISLHDKSDPHYKDNDAKVEEEEENAKISRARRIKTSIDAAFYPIMRVNNPLPESASWWQKLKYGLMLPPRGNFAHYLQLGFILLQVWGVLAALTKNQALPGGNFFSLLVVLVTCHLFSLLFGLFRLPPLVGMLLMGLLLRNVPGIKIIGESLDSNWASALRKLALTVILTRAGLGLDVVKLKKLSFAVLRLAFTPCLAEAITVSIAAHFLLEFPWEWSLLLGCILGALSPAVTVPLLVNLQDRKYGVAKGIPTMCLAAGGLDNVFCVTAFAVFLGIIFSGGDSIAVTIIKGPLGVLVGIAYGFIMGFLLWYLPSKDTTSRVCFRVLMLLGSGMIAIFGSSAVGLSGAGPLGCLTTATVAAFRWRKERKEGETDEVSGVMAVLWLIIQHFLFGLIGAAVNVQDIHPSTAGLGIASLFIGLCVRSIVSFTVTMGTGFNLKERIFITLTWISKATVQAAIGGLALDRAMSSDPVDQKQIQMGTDVLTLAVLAIIICAPVGATCMTILGPRLLVKGESEREGETPSGDVESGASTDVVNMRDANGNGLHIHENAAYESDDIKKDI